MSEGSSSAVSPAQLEKWVADIFCAAGIGKAESAVVAQALVEADMEGLASHGVMLLPMYIARIQAGSVSTAPLGEVVSDQGSAIVIDAKNVLGQLTARQAVSLLKQRARDNGLAAVAVRNAFHFGAAGKWAQELADAGFVGIVMSNTRPLMPALGGAERMVGNNPIAIAVPSAQQPPLVLDMALSAAAMGKIRLADAAGQPIPDGWATDAKGSPTTSAAEAIKGMLLPAAGPKGFGLAFMIDLLCGGLSGGAMGEAVRPLYGRNDEPYGCAHFFLAIDVAKFMDPSLFATTAAGFAERIRSSTPAPGVQQIFTPGEPAWALKQRNLKAGVCPVAAETMAALKTLATGLGVPSIV